MAERLVTTAEQALLLPVIVSQAPEVHDWALQLGLVAISEDEPGLDFAARTGTAWAVGHGLAWVVIHSDLPLVQPSDLRVISDGVENGRDVIAPSSDGGTSALATSEPIEFAYGPGSFHRHLRQLRDPLITVATGTLHDLDSANDLMAATHHREGWWLRPIVGLER